MDAISKSAKSKFSHSKVFSTNTSNNRFLFTGGYISDWVASKLSHYYSDDSFLKIPSYLKRGLLSSKIVSKLFEI